MSDEQHGNDATLESGGRTTWDVPDDHELKAGVQVGEYVIENELGRGAFGTVYGAIHPIIGKRVAIKVLALKYSVDPQVTSRFISEARAVNQIGHEHIIDIFGFGELPDKRRYYVMEHLDGLPLDEHLKENGPLSIEETISILGPIAQALDAAHCAGIAHRDLKPANVYLARRKNGWFPKLLDFGIAKLMADDLPKDHQTATGAAVGTPYYMSPEQCMGTNVDHRTDLYSFGVMAFQMLTGKLPFMADSTVEILVKHINDAPPAPSEIRPDLTAYTSSSILRLMSKAPSDRPDTLCEAVTTLSQEMPAVPGPKSNRALLGGLALLAAGAVVAAAIMLRPEAEPPRPELPPETPAAQVTPEPPPTPVPAKTALVKIAGEPAGAEVLDSSGKVLGVLGDALVLPYGVETIELRVRSKGYKSKQVEVVPNKNHDLQIRLVKIVRAPRPTTTRPTSTKPVPTVVPPKPRAAPSEDDLDTWE